LSTTVIPVLPGPAPAALQTIIVIAKVPVSFQVVLLVVFVSEGLGGTGVLVGVKVGVLVGQGMVAVTGTADALTKPSEMVALFINCAHQLFGK
jgi:hypothetical protein